MTPGVQVDISELLYLVKMKHAIAIISARAIFIVTGWLRYKVAKRSTSFRLYSHLEAVFCQAQAHILQKK